MKSRFTLVSRMLSAFVILLFLWAYLFQEVLVALAGSFILLYLAYRRVEFHSLAKRIRIGSERKLLEGVVHRESPVTIKVEITSMETVMVRCSDGVPKGFRHISGELSTEGMVHPDRPLSFTYSLMPLERGYFELPSLDITIIESRRLFSASVNLDPETEVFVRASKREIALARLMSKRKQFEVTGPAHTRHTRTFRADFRSVREYMPGDRFRDIDWKAGARLTRLMTKEFETETNLPTMIMLDSSLSMKEVIRSRSKIDHAIALALQIAVVMDSHNHPVGMISFDENKVIQHLSPGKCDIEEVVLTLFRTPNPIQTGGYPGLPPENDQVDDGHGEAQTMLDKIAPFLVKGPRKSYSSERSTGIFEAARALDRTEESGMLLVLISDLETNPPSILKALQLAMKRKHRVVLISPFSWPYHVNADDVDEDKLERIYIEYTRKQRMVRGLRAGGVRVIEIGSKERGERVITGLRRMSQ